MDKSRVERIYFVHKLNFSLVNIITISISINKNLNFVTLSFVTIKPQILIGQEIRNLEPKTLE
jgi:hypothetical protein